MPLLKNLSYSSYNIIFSLFNQFGLVVEYNKLKVFYFLRITKKIESFPLNLKSIGSTIFKSKDIWHYLDFFFDKILSFQYHIHYYTNKALSTIKSIKMLGNSIRRLFLIYKHLLYRTCILSIILFRS